MKDYTQECQEYWDQYAGKWVGTDKYYFVLTSGDSATEVKEKLDELGLRGIVWRVRGKDEPITEWTEFEPVRYRLS